MNKITIGAALATSLLLLSGCCSAPQGGPSTQADYDDDIVRLSRIEIDPQRIDEYKAFLKEEAETSMQVEPGVRMLYAVFEQDTPHKLTILEIYDNKEAYQSHIKTPHFLKYKQGTLDMVKSLDIVDTDPLSPQMLMKP